MSASSGSGLTAAKKPFLCTFVREDDERKVNATEELMRECAMLQTMIGTGNLSEEQPFVYFPESEEYQLDHVHVIIEYLQMKQKYNPESLAPKRETVIARLPKWSNAFFNGLKQCDLVDAANLSAYLMCDSFKHDVCAFIADRMDCMKVPQLREHLRIQADFTGDEWRALLQDPDFREVIDADGVLNQKTSVPVPAGGFNSDILCGVAKSRLANQNALSEWRLRRFFLCGPSGRDAVHSSLQGYVKARLDYDTELYRKETDPTLFLEATEFLIVVRRGMAKIREVVFGEFLGQCLKRDDMHLKGIEKAEFEWVDLPDICTIRRIVDDNKDTLKTLVKPTAEILAELPPSLSLDLLVMGPLTQEMEEEGEQHNVLSRFQIKRLEYDKICSLDADQMPSFIRWIRVEQLKLSGVDRGIGSTNGAQNTKVKRLETAYAWPIPPSSVNFGNIVLHVKHTFPSLTEWSLKYNITIDYSDDATDLQESVEHLKAAERAFKSLSFKADIELHLQVTLLDAHHMQAASSKKLLEGFEPLPQTVDPENQRNTERVFKREVKLNETVDFKIFLELCNRA